MFARHSLSLPGCLEREAVHLQLQQPDALAEGQLLGGCAVDVVDEIQRPEAALLEGHRAWQDVFDKQDAVDAVAAATQHKTWRQNSLSRPEYGGGPWKRHHLQSTGAGEAA